MMNVLHFKSRLRKELMMSFQNMKNEELKEIAEFFNVDVVAANPDNGPTKKEYVAALASGDNPVTLDDYNNIFLVAKENDAIESEEVENLENPLPDENIASSENTPAPVEAKSTLPEEVTSESKNEVENEVFVKFERKNPSYEILGYSFSSRHPFASVPESVAAYLINKEEGFRLALSSEVSDYYN